jgi:uncharacterized membrane protein (UPF0127 family)
VRAEVRAAPDSPARGPGRGDGLWCVRNLTRDIVLAPAARLAWRPWDRALGLLGAGALAPGAGLVIRPCRAVHSIGLRLPLDVVYVGLFPGEHARPPWSAAGGPALRVCRLPPGRLGPFVPAAQGVIELPAGAAGGTEPGDAIGWEPC